jgi:CheY-like chemotaxis protein
MAAPPPGSAAGANAWPPLRGAAVPAKTILIVENDEATRVGFGLILQQRGYTVALTANGSEGLIYLQTHAHPALIILDMLMGGMDGWQFIQHRDAHWPNVPILIATAIPSATDEWAVSLGACGCVRKPVDENILTDKVVKCLEFPAA